MTPFGRDWLTLFAAALACAVGVCVLAYVGALLQARGGLP